MTARRISVPTSNVLPYWDLGWAYVMPDFDNKNHSIIEWLAENEPKLPVATASDQIQERKSA